jgi:cysteine desulfurase
MARIYLDHNASTPVRAEVLEAMAPYFGEKCGNASSAHAFGQESRGAIEEARAAVASFLNASPGEIVFTSGGTESDNLAVIGGARALRPQGRHVVSSAIEHDAVRHAVDLLEREGFEVTRVPPAPTGRVAPEAVEAAIRPDTIIVTVMASNNENGVIQPIAEIGAICAARGVVFHTDAVQAAGKIPIDVKAWQVTMATITAHKFYGPKGAGALYVKSGFKPAPLQVGGEHEKGRRAGTENVPAIVGLARACQLAGEDVASTAARLAALRDRLESGIQRRIPQVVIHGAGAPRVCNTSHISFVGVEGEHVVLGLDMKGVAVSAAAACKTGSAHPSHVLLSMGVPPAVAQAAVRFSLGRSTTEAEIARVLEIAPTVVEKLRAASPSFAS